MKLEQQVPQDQAAARQGPETGVAGARVVLLPRPRGLHVIYNPTAGRRGRLLFSRTLRALSLAGCRITVSETSGPGQATDLAGREGDYDVLVVAGGDGTVNEAVNGVVGRNIALGVIPLGTANVLAHEIGLRRRSDRLARLIARAAPRSVHLGRIDHADGVRHFIIMAGAGFDARLVASVNKRLKKRTGKFAYVWRMLFELARYRTATYRVVADGAEYHAASVVVANGRYYGGRFVLAPDASLEDARLYVCLFERGGRWNAVRYAVCMALGLLGRLSDYRVVPARQVRIEGPEDDPVQADGDIVAKLPVTIRMAIDTVPLIGAVGDENDPA